MDFNSSISMCCSLTNEHIIMKVNEVNFARLEVLTTNGWIFQKASIFCRILSTALILHMIIYRTVVACIIPRVSIALYIRSCALLCRKKKLLSYTFHAPQRNTIRQDETHVEKGCYDKVNQRVACKNLATLHSLCKVAVLIK